MTQNKEDTFDVMKEFLSIIEESQEAFRATQTIQEAFEAIRKVHAELGNTSQVAELNHSEANLNIANSILNTDEVRELSLLHEWAPDVDVAMKGVTETRPQSHVQARLAQRIADWESRTGRSLDKELKESMQMSPIPKDAEFPSSGRADSQVVSSLVSVPGSSKIKLRPPESVAKLAQRGIEKRKNTGWAGMAERLQKALNLPFKFDSKQESEGAEMYYYKALESQGSVILGVQGLSEGCSVSMALTLFPQEGEERLSIHTLRFNSREEALQTEHLLAKLLES